METIHTMLATWKQQNKPKKPHILLADTILFGLNLKIKSKGTEETNTQNQQI